MLQIYYIFNAYHLLIWLTNETGNSKWKWKWKSNRKWKWNWWKWKLWRDGSETGNQCSWTASSSLLSPGFWSASERWVLQHRSRHFNFNFNELFILSLRRHGRSNSPLLEVGKYTCNCIDKWCAYSISTLSAGKWGAFAFDIEIIISLFLKKNSINISF